MLLAIIKPRNILASLSDVNMASDIIKCLNIIVYPNDVVW